MLIAIDAGGTSTRCAVVTPAGRVIGYGRAGSGNAVSVGMASAFAAHAAAVATALATAGVSGSTVTGGVTATAGFSIHGDAAEKYRAALAGIGVSAPVHFGSDALAGYFSGTASLDGYVLISGTGAAALRVRAGITVAVADGLGWLLGDVGSGYWIGRAVVRAALADLEGRGPHTKLTPQLIAELGLTDEYVDDQHRSSFVTEIMKRVYPEPPVFLARFAHLAFEVLSEDDVAQGIINEAASGLAATLDAVLQQPESDTPTSVVATGGVLSGQPELRDRITFDLAARGRAVEFIPVSDGLAGAVSLALRDAGVDVDEALLSRIRADLATLAP